jgi:uncharacterized protein YbcI
MTGTDQDRAGAVRASLAEALVSLQKRLYGRGPEAARAFVEDEYVFVVLDGGLTRSEETLLAAGEEDMVRAYRLRYQAAVADEYTACVEGIIGRKVVAYHSQMVFDPPRAFEIFVLEK